MRKPKGKRITARRADRWALLVGEVDNQMDSYSSATQDCNASEVVDGDQAEDLTVADGLTFINGVRTQRMKRLYRRVGKASI